MNLAFVIFTKNEADSIQSLLAELNALGSTMTKKSYKLFVVDDSSDGTDRLASTLGAEIVKSDNKGLGSAFTLICEKLARLAPYDQYCFLDGDGQACLDDIPAFLNAQKLTNSDLIIGSRFLRNDSIKYSYPTANALGTKILACYLTLVLGQKVTDSHGGIRIYSYRAISKMKTWGKHTYVQESLVIAKLHHFKITEISCAWNPRKYGKSKVVSSILLYVAKTAPVLVLRLLQIVVINAWKLTFASE